MSRGENGSGGTEEVGVKLFVLCNVEKFSTSVTDPAGAAARHGFELPLMNRMNADTSIRC
jgi:hypothetical protein